MSVAHTMYTEPSTNKKVKNESSHNVELRPLDFKPKKSLQIHITKHSISHILLEISFLTETFQISKRENYILLKPHSA